MGSFLVETFAPPLLPEQWDVLVERARDAAVSLSESGTPVVHVRAYHVPEDEMAFHVYEAPSADDARKAAELAGIEPERVVVLVDAETRSGATHGAIP